MLLLVDIGNTYIKVKYEIVKTIESDLNLKVTDLISILGEYKFLGVTEVSGVIISSVVPKLTELFIKYSKEVLEIEPIIVNNQTSRYELTFHEEIGADIISTINAVVGENIIIMLGTATVISYVNDGIVHGAIIAPGVNTSVSSLVNNTALLNDFILEVPKEILGKNSTECMQSGAFFGHAAMIDGLIDRISATDNAKIIAMGGFATKIIPLCNHDIEIDNELLFKGLEKIYYHNVG
ncbi:type III pantothenate kinase [Mycoplasmatota bacterium]|nr:type III pantothenate kinase [Mycoplasmatota bacterium]